MVGYLDSPCDGAKSLSTSDVVVLRGHHYGCRAQYFVLELGLCQSVQTCPDELVPSALYEVI
jgi:hypothetical protein